MVKERIRKTRSWLVDHALPLWSSRGVDWEQGGFVENLSIEGQRLDGPKRSMVQARQIYTFRIARDLELFPRQEAERIAAHSADFLVNHAFLPEGAVAHQVGRNGGVANAMPDLYAQAFAIFAMANAFRVNPKPEYREKALGVVRYLETSRKVAAGGFTEVKDGVQYQSNPHMHLFEAFIAWMEIDTDPTWRGLADQIFTLCRTKFIDGPSGLLGEHFDENWTPIRPAGKFIFEPGHQFEWAWLMKNYEKLTGTSTHGIPERLFHTSEKHGIWRPRATAYDEVWSDFTPHKKSSRFWPQTERIKAAVILRDAGAADEALDVLFKFIDSAKVPGLFYDSWMEDGSFVAQPAGAVKASSLYHIIGGMNEYLRFREQL